MSIPNKPAVPRMIPVESVKKTEIKSINAKTMVEHMVHINYNLETRNNKLTQIMCTIGPSSQMPVDVEGMLDSGMNVARLNLVHGDHEYFRQAINSIRIATNNFSTEQGLLMPLAIAVEVHGAEIRTGALDISQPTITEVQLFTGDDVMLTCTEEYYGSCNESTIYIDYPKLLETLRPKDRVDIDDGTIMLEVASVGVNTLKCTIKRGGMLRSNRIVTLPDVPVELKEVTDLTIRDIQFAVKHEVDFIIITVRNAHTIQQCRDALDEDGKYLRIIARIETDQAMDNIPEIVAVADGILFSKHRAANAMHIQNAYLAQKHILGHCIMAGKPMICAVFPQGKDQNAYPCTRVMSDVANAIIDGVHCFMFTEETAIGTNPIDSVNNLTKVCQQSEATLWHRQIYAERNLLAETPQCPAEGIAIGAVETANKCDAQAIVVLTTTGRSAMLLSKYTPRCPIIAITRFGRVARQLQIYRGVRPLHYIYGVLPDWTKDVNLRLQYGVTYGKVMNFILAGDAVLLVSGCRQGAGFTNALRIVYASEYDTIPA